MSEFKFTFANIEDQYRSAVDAGYKVITCEEYYKRKSMLPAKTLVNRVDIDLSVKKAERLADIFNRLKIKATFFVRLHAPEYNPFDFENYRVLKSIIKNGHELGYHSEIVDQSKIWQEDAADNLRRDIDVMNRMFGIEIKGVASHGGNTGLNNLDFWKDKKASDFGLLYEAYDKQPEFNLFQEAFYISDSEWIRWKCYNKGVKVENDFRNIMEHLQDNHHLLHVLIHPDTYFDRHFYE
jgi:hypothetical protein